MVVGLVGGSGLERFFEEGSRLGVETPYGLITIYEGMIDDVKVYFVPRHGPRHEYPPHRVNYKGNMYALGMYGVDRVIAVSAVGSIDEALPPGSLVLVNQFIDFTKRHITFYDDAVVHVDVTRPYCQTMNRILFNKGRELGIGVRYGGIYVCTEGPRFETPAEINMFRLLGGNIVGMTNVPEVVLARELGLHYSLICVVTNYAAGMQERVSQDEVLRVMERAEDNIRRIIYSSIKDIDGFEVRDDCILFRESAERYIFKR